MFIAAFSWLARKNMEQNYNAPKISPEQTPSLPPVMPEFLPNQDVAEFEKAPSRVEAEPLPQAPVATVVQEPVAVQSVAADPATDSVPGDDFLTSLPDVASDDDRIEKDWVDKAKDIIAKTADDPHSRERAIGALQRDYVKKRYGKEIGTAE